LCRSQRPDQVTQRPHQLVQASEGDLGLALDSGRTQHSHACGALDRVREQRGLPRTRRTADNEHRTARGVHSLKQRTNSCPLSLRPYRDMAWMLLGD